jgi:2-dehydro-3-deoxyphosphooctonate aldolase (KDO 8-P synthase)
MRSFMIMKLNGCPTIFDATHSVQLPGINSNDTGGDKIFVATLAKAALASGADVLFFEIHPDPAKATCDAANQIELKYFPLIISDCLCIWNAMKCLSAEVWFF